MSRMNSKFRYMYDAAPASALIAKDGAAHVATFNGTAIALDELDGYWNTNELADEVFAIAVNVTAIDHTTGDETYTVELEFGPAGFATSVKTSKLTIGAVGQYAILVDAATLRAMKADGNTIRLVGTLAGTTPSITLHAWIAGAIVDAN
jgi:hypothetical protein